MGYAEEHRQKYNLVLADIVNWSPLKMFSKAAMVRLIMRNRYYYD